MSSKTKSEKKNNVKTLTSPGNGNSLKKPEKNKKRYLKYCIILVITVIAGIIIAGVKYFDKDNIKRNAAASIEFAYNGAAQNLTPNGEQFSINEIKSESIIGKALENVGLSDRYTYESIASNIKISAGYPQDVIEKIKGYNSLYDFSGSRNVYVNEYYPTVFDIRLFDSFDTSVSDGTLKSIVNAIVEVYKQEFIKKYVYAFDMDDYGNLLKLTDYDFAQRVKILKLRLQILENYASEMYESNISFKFNGQSFNDFVLKCRILENDSLSNIEASVMSDVLTTSVSRLKNQYEYEIKLLENELKYKNQNIEEIKTLIDSYKRDGRIYIVSGDSPVVVEGNSKETYEKLMDEKKEISEKIVNISSEIEKYKLYLTDLKTAVYSSNSKTNAVSDNIEAVNEKICLLEDSFKDMMEAYNRTVIRDSDIILGNTRYQGASVFSGSFILMAVKCAAPLCIIVMIALSINALLIEIKKKGKA